MPQAGAGRRASSRRRWAQFLRQTLRRLRRRRPTRQPGELATSLSEAARLRRKTRFPCTGRFSFRTRPSGAQAFLALYENDLSNQVTADENRGKRLQHDFVVRELSGPHATDSQGDIALSHRFKLDPLWKSADLHIAAFVQNERTGEVLQALATPSCR
ncbi:MAG: DUF1223 domain-containing protein [Betaproteobacteria bacterium]|nr:DUF1223 domain-containing protein [Betaproteobacteria bacterium]